ncbi:MAG: hypothetical protein ONB45_04310 [candidate division KSB1 bacterium]|nr:hypothetical protein [candidate division KSB1 bacterium]
MRETLKSYLAKGVALCMLASLSLVACTKHPSQEQLKALEETRQAAAAAETQKAQKCSERDDMQRQLQQKKADLQKVQNEKAAVAGRLNQ